MATLTLTDAELSWLSVAALAHARTMDSKPGYVQTAIAKLSPDGDSPTTEEFREIAGRDWYISPTGRKLKSWEKWETPLTLERYHEIERMALQARGARILSEFAA